MTDESATPQGPGFQGSDKSGCEVVFYSHGGDPVFNLSDLSGGGLKVLGPVDGAGDQNANPLANTCAVQNVSWTKTIGGGSGRFQMAIKTRHADIFEKGLMDDDWVDITFTQHDRKYHTVRGVIDTIREQRNPGSGATEKTFLVTGRDHTKPFEATNVFFNRYIGDNVGGGATLYALINSNLAANVFGAVDKTVQAFLFMFMRQL